MIPRSPVSAILSACMITFVSASLGQTTFYVNGLCGDDAWTGANPTCQAPYGPKRTIQAGIGTSTTGDTVIVADGTYAGFGNRDLDFGGKDITVRSANGPEHCIIDGEGRGRGFHFRNNEGPDAVVEGFTIRNGAVPEDRRFSARGGGIYCERGSPTIRHCTIVGNTADSEQYFDAGGGLYLSGASTIEHCTIVDNVSDSDGGGVFCSASSNVTLINCLIGRNSAGRGGGVYSEERGRCTIINCTIAGNSSYRGGGIYSDVSRVTVNNSILWDNGIQDIWDYFNVVVLRYSAIRGGWAGRGNIDTDPLLLESGHDCRLRIGSPCIDAGDNAVMPSGVTFDLYGDPRFADDPDTSDTRNVAQPIVDMGASEFTYQPLPPDPVTDLVATDGTYARRVALTWRHSRYAEEYRVFRHTLNDPNAAGAVSDWLGESSFDDASAEPGVTYWYWVWARSRYGDSGWSAGDSGLRRVARTIHVPSEQSTIQTGIDEGLNGDVVLVADGTYRGPGNTNLDFGGRLLIVRSENGPGTCIIDCERQGRGFIFQNGETRDAIVEGFTITNGHVDFNTPWGISGGGIMMRGGSPTISECHITDNRAAALGGGINCDTISSPLIIDCTIARNWADYGGGAIFCNGMGNDATIINSIIRDNVADSANGGGVACGGNNTTLTNCIIAGNTANRNGGGLYYDGGDPPITNCVFIDNVAVQNGGGVYCQGDTILYFTNCIFWGNEAVLGPQMTVRNSVSNVTISYCDVQGGQSGVFLENGGVLVWGDGNIDADPEFASSDDFHLTAASPCVDAGTNDPPDGLAGGDLDGNMRVWNGRVDMGAYEFGSHRFGDLGCDGAFNGGDIDPFFLALGDPAGYAIAFPNCDPLLGDMNGDGRLDGADIDPFFACLGGGACP